MRVLLRGPFAELELRSWTELARGDVDGERLRPSDELEARMLLRSALTDDARHSIRALLFELEPESSFGRERDDTPLDRLARLIVRGQVIVERRPIDIMPSEVVERYDPPEHEPFENEFAEEVKVVHWLESEDPPLVVFDSEPEPPTIVIFYGEVEPPPIVVFDSEPEPPPIVVYDSEASGVIE